MYKNNTVELIGKQSYIYSAFFFNSIVKEAKKDMEILREIYGDSVRIHISKFIRI
jgi:hypothetical protein